MINQVSSPFLGTRSVLSKVSKAVAQLGVLCTVLMMLMIVADVLMRFLFNEPILGSVELASYMLSVIAFTTIPLVESEERHIVIPVFFDHFPRRVRLAIYTFVSLLGICTLAFIAWSSFDLAAEYARRGKITSILSIPVYPFVYLSAVCLTLYAVIMVFNLVNNVCIKRSI